MLHLFLLIVACLVGFEHLWVLIVAYLIGFAYMYYLSWQVVRLDVNALTGVSIVEGVMFCVLMSAVWFVFAFYALVSRFMER